MEDSSRQKGVRKRAPNACSRCRRQKIKCTGNSPCEPCSRRGLSCKFETGQQKVLVSRSFLDQLERQAALGADGQPQWIFSPRNGTHEDPNGTNEYGRSGIHPEHENNQTPHTRLGALRHTSVQADEEESITAQADISRDSESEEPDPDSIPVTAEDHLVNPLAPGNLPTHSYTENEAGKKLYFGPSSNWAFARRILNMAHEHVSTTPLQANSLLLFEGTAYNLGWDGHMAYSDDVQSPVLPTLDFALYLINSVKFRCGQLYHVFHEEYFMECFQKFHEGWTPPLLWKIHYLIILAFGKALVVQTKSSERPNGAELFVHAMKLLPHTLFLSSNGVDAIEVLSCASLYLQCLDFRSAAYNMAARIALDHGMNADIQSDHFSDADLERRRRAWWTVYVLDRQISSLQGCSVAFADDDVSTRLPAFSGSIQSSMALGIHVKLCKASTMIQQTVYGQGPDKSKRFLSRIKDALKTVGSANDDRNMYFPLDLKKPGGISRLSAYLHLFHHQSIALATRPLLFVFYQKRLESLNSLRVTSSGGARSMLRACVGSSIQSISILTALQTQGLLESFLPFDLQSVASAASIIIVASAVDASLVRERDRWIETSFSILDEIMSQGNLIAKFQKSELQDLENKLKMLPTTPRSQPTVDPPTSETFSEGDHWSAVDGWNSDHALSGDQLVAWADSLDFGQLDWLDSDLTFL